MPTNYPGALDTTAELKNDAVNATVSLNTHKVAHNNLADANIAIQTELGILPKGSFADVAARLGNAISREPGSSQVIRPNGDWIPLVCQAHSTQNNSRLFEVRNSSGTAIAWFDRLGGFNAQGYRVDGSNLASTHLADSANILKNPSPSITTPTISSPAFTGTPVSTTPPVDNNSTRIATTAYVINQGYAKSDSPAFTGTPTAPTPPTGNESTRIATTAYTVSEILARQVSSIPVGAITSFGGSSAPTGWLLCDGSGYSTTTYSALFNVIGYTYGGSGSTFNVPDLRGRMLVGLGTHADVDALGDNDAISVANRRPGHGHDFSITDSSAGGHSHSSNSSSTDGNHHHSFTGASGSVGLDDSAPQVSAGASSSQSTSSSGSHSHSLGVDEAGGHGHVLSGTIGLTGVSNAPAYIVINYIIKA